jgi:uncharacterized protein
VAGYFELKSAANASFMFNLKAGNHEVILTSELYTTKAAAENGIATVKTHASSDANFKRKATKDKSPYFVLVASNGQTIGKSEMYTGVAGMENGIKSVMNNAPTATIKDRTA